MDRATQERLLAQAIREYREGERYPQGPDAPEWLVEAIHNPKPSLVARIRRLLRL